MSKKFSYYSSFGYDADALAFFTAASITDTTQKTAINTLVLGLKSASIWSKIPCIYPFVGGNATSHSFNLKNPATFQLTFFGGWTHSATGALPNGTNAYAKTGFIPDNHFTTLPANGFGFYTNTNILSGQPIALYQSAANCFMYMNMDGNYWLNGSISANVGHTITDSRGHSLIQRFSSSDLKAYANGVQKAASTYSPNSLSASIEFYLGALNLTGTPVGFSAHNQETAHFHNDLSVTNIGDLYTLLLNYNTTLSRA